MGPLADLMSWRGKYFFTAAAYRERIIDGEAILGGGDLSSLYRGLARIPHSERRCYAAAIQRCGGSRC